MLMQTNLLVSLSGINNLTNHGLYLLPTKGTMAGGMNFWGRLSPQPYSAKSNSNDQNAFFF